MLISFPTFQNYHWNRNYFKFQTKNWDYERCSGATLRKMKFISSHHCKNFYSKIGFNVYEKFEDCKV